MEKRQVPGADDRPPKPSRRGKKAANKEAADKEAADKEAADNEAADKEERTEAGSLVHSASL